MSTNLLTLEEWEALARQADFNAAKMAALCSISERQLQRLFRNNLHCTPSRWLRNLQCRLARDLIAQGCSNKVATSTLKFANESHFCREFKKVFGTSPQTFAPGRRAHPRRVPSISKSSWKVLTAMPPQPL